MSYQQERFNGITPTPQSPSFLSLTSSFYTDMDVGDTARVNITIDGGASDNADLSGNASEMRNYLGGKLLQAT